MSEKHTHGPMRQSGFIISYGVGKGAIADTPAIARRLVACWNACESFSTEMLEGAMSAVVQGGFVGLWSNYCDKKSEAEDLHAQRDELLAALKLITDRVEFCTTPEEMMRHSPTIKHARDAIAKATGGKA